MVSLNDEVYKHRIENVGLLVLTPEQREGATVALEKRSETEDGW